MKTTGYIFLGVVALIALLLIGWGTSWFGLVTQRPMAQYAKETERRVYLNSVTHQQGAESGIAIDCSNMRNTSLAAAQRHAFASLVTQDAAGYGGSAELSADAQACIQEARGLLSQPLP